MRDHITQAWGRIAPHVLRTPVLETRHIGGRHLHIKMEHMQLTGSFKLRGAFNSLLAGDVPEGGVVAASGGNHGAAVAHAATSLGHRAKIFVPEFAGPAKISVIRATGADLTVVEGTYAEAFAQAQAHEAATGAMQIHAFDAAPTVHGQGTVFAEWDAQGLEADTVLIAVGGGGLISGAMGWFDGARNVVAVEAEGTGSLNAALETGPDTQIEVSGLTANALGARQIGRICYDLATKHKITSVLVADDAVADAQAQIWSDLRQWVEPAAAAPLAALTSGAYVPSKDERVAILLCGANPVDAPVR